MDESVTCFDQSGNVTVIEREQNDQGNDSGIENEHKSPAVVATSSTASLSINSCQLSRDSSLVSSDDTTTKDLDQTSEVGSECSSSFSGHGSGCSGTSAQKVKKRVTYDLRDSSSPQKPVVARKSTETKTLAKKLNANDGRWPNIATRAVTKCQSPRLVTTKAVLLTANIKMSSPRDLKITNTPKTNVVPSKTTDHLMDTRRATRSPSVDRATLDKYATLPRRRRDRSHLSDVMTQSAHDFETPRSRSVAREHSLSRASRKLPGTPPSSPRKCLVRTRIYHEVAAQTALTSDDLDRAFDGTSVRPPGPNTVQTNNVAVQATIEQTKLESQLMMMMDKNRVLTHELDVHGNLARVCKQQESEIAQLRALCASLQAEVRESETERLMLIEQHKDAQRESHELEEFMQAEKHALAEVLRETEQNTRALSQQVHVKHVEVERIQDECQHLVRVSEQRRQENLTLQVQLSSIESKYKELLNAHAQANTATSHALVNLRARLNDLFEQLKSTHGISHVDLEDAIYHNEVFSEESSEASGAKAKIAPESCVKVDGEPDKRRSFLSAVIGAIRNATHGGGVVYVDDHPRKTDKDVDDVDHFLIDYDTSESSAADLLDSETEPVLMMDSVLSDVETRDTHTHNMVSSLTHALITKRSESLDNLSEAILVRQQAEKMIDSEMRMPSDDNAARLVDQVISIDNLVTQLLKVLHIVTSDERNRAIARSCMQVLDESRRQYQAIDNALEVLLSVEDIVKKCPALMDLQKNLEQVNFQSASSIPLPHQCL